MASPTYPGAVVPLRPKRPYSTTTQTQLCQAAHIEPHGGTHPLHMLLICTPHPFNVAANSKSECETTTMGLPHE